MAVREFLEEKMRNIKLVISDLDLTLLHTNKDISEYTQNVFKKCSDYGVYTAIATARYRLGSEKFIDILKPDFEITTDGTMIYSEGELVYGCGLSLHTTNALISRIKNLNGNQELTVATDSSILWNSLHIADSPILNKAVYNDFSKSLEMKAYKIVTELPDFKLAYSIANEFPECRMISYRGESRYGFVNKNAGKMQAIRALANLLNIELSEIAAFGDDLNDIEMIKQCGHGVAVSNALQEVKTIADFITESNDEDGVAKFIEKYIFSCKELT